MRRPAHAQPGALASLRWTSLLESVLGVGALLVIAAMAIASGGGSSLAAAGKPVPARTQNPMSSTVALGWTLLTPSSSMHPVSSAPPRATSSPTTQAPTNLAAASALAADGIPLTALQAYQSAAVQQNLTTPGCHLPWPLLAAIGRVESDHGRFGGAVLHTDGLSTPRVIGIALDGHGTALIRDTDGGRLDGDSVYDRAVGPMQFIPSTWRGYAADGNGDGVADPFNIFDAAAAAARYLCAAGGNLAAPAGQQRAVLAYNHSAAYLSAVLHLEAVYAAGVPGLSIPIIPTGPPPPVPTNIPPVNPAPPLSITPSSTAPGAGSGTASGPRTPTGSGPADTPDRSSTASSGAPTPSCPASSPTATSSSATSSSATSSAATSTPAGSTTTAATSLAGTPTGAASSTAASASADSSSASSAVPCPQTPTGTHAGGSPGGSSSRSGAAATGTGSPD